MSFVEEFKEVMHGDKIKFWKNAFPNTLTWDHFVYQRHEGNKTRPTRWDNPDFSITYEIEGSPNMVKIPEFEFFRNSLLAVWGDRLWDEPAHIMSTTLGKAGGLWLHEDGCEQIHWNCFGKTKWTTIDLDGKEENYFMEPGDVIFLPIGIKHGVETLEQPRAGIAYSIKLKDMI